MDLSLSRIFVEFSLKPVYPTLVGETCQINVSITRKCICESKTQSLHSIHVPSQNSLPGSYHHPLPPPSTQREISFASGKVIYKLYFSPPLNREGEWKETMHHL